MPRDLDAHAARAGEAGIAARYPGLWQAGLVVALSALLATALGRPRPDVIAPDAVSRIAEVGPADVKGALGTVEASQAQLAALAEGRACDRRLAWVTIMRGPGQPHGRIRLQSGSYISPAFDLTDMPVRVALPYPAPYAIGHGTLSVFGTTADAVVALQPAWPVSVADPRRTREVSWQPSDACRVPGG